MEVQNHGSVIIGYFNFNCDFFKLIFVFTFKKLSQLVSSEFFSEGDLEKEKFKQEPIVNYYSIKLSKLKFMKRIR